MLSNVTEEVTMEFQSRDGTDVLLTEPRMKQFPEKFSKEMVSLKQSLLHCWKKGTRVL